MGPSAVTRAQFFSRTNGDTSNGQVGRGNTAAERTALHPVAMRRQSKTPADGRPRLHRRIVVTWVTAILMLVFSLAGCDGERDYLHQTTTSSSGAAAFSAAEAEFCSAPGGPDEQPHARHLASNDFAVAGSDTAKARVASDQGGHVAVEGAPTPATFSLSTVPLTSLGGRDILTHFCISRR
ncbi:hypothetical protein IU449_19560 [Nocardia higoensis]|uniref:Lipoprotein n=1 Tax=Nocardia higoensis TaxID=228599 RepID=A0ABS0DE32_9NOCA|nr:hypothetical protein [Nocardia higoensis]